MTRDDAWAWLCAHLEEGAPEAVVMLCQQHQDKLEAIATTLFHASDPRRQQLKISIRTIMTSQNT